MTRDWNLLLLDDHQTTERAIAGLEKALAGPAVGRDLVAKMLDYFGRYVDQCHNMKEEHHLFPLIESRGVPRQGGPLAVMLMEHEQGRGILARLKTAGEAYLVGDSEKLGEIRAVFAEYGELLKNHFWKENDILYPMALRVMSTEDGATVVAGIEATEASLGPETRERYYALAQQLADAGDIRDLSYGVERDVLAAVLNTLPVELSFVDADDTVRYFSHENHDKIFPRTRGAIGMKVQQCHPERSVEKVNAILEDFKAGRRSVAEFWIDFADKKVHIRYLPVRDASDRYLGCLEVVQDISGIQRLEGQRRLLDEP